MSPRTAMKDGRPGQTPWTWRGCLRNATIIFLMSLKLSNVPSKLESRISHQPPTSRHRTIPCPCAELPEMVAPSWPWAFLGRRSSRRRHPRRAVGRASRHPGSAVPGRLETLGRRAGPIRNQEMAEYGEALIAVWDGRSRSAGNMIQLAGRRGLKVFGYLIEDGTALEAKEMQQSLCVGWP
jgi:hypothetical protein